MLSRLSKCNHLYESAKHQQKRNLHIRGSYPVLDQLSKISSLIIETGNDQREDESYSSYLNRSLIELSHAVPPDLQSKVICWAKINTTVIDYLKWKSGEVKPIYTGHLSVGLGKIEGDTFNVCADATISKVPNPLPLSPFEDVKDVIEKSFIASKTRYAANISRNSQEYFCFFTLDKTKITIKSFKERCKKLKLEQKPYHLMESNCSHAGYEVLTGEKITIKYQPKQHIH